MATPAMQNRKGYAYLEPRPGSFYQDFLCTVVLLKILLVWLVDGVYSAIIGRIAQGKLGEWERLFSLNALLYLGACFGVAVVTCCLPKAVRYPLQGAIGGAFTGYIPAMFFARMAGETLAGPRFRLLVFARAESLPFP